MRKETKMAVAAIVQDKTYPSVKSKIIIPTLMEWRRFGDHLIIDFFYIKNINEYIEI